MGLPVLARGAQLANRLRGANNIIRFGRKAKAVHGLSGAARAEILLQSAKTLALPQVPSLTGPIFRTLFTATSFLVGVWASLNKPKVKPDAPVEPLPSTGTFEINLPDDQRATVSFRTSVETRSAATYRCNNNQLNDPASTTQEPWKGRTFFVVGNASITTATASSEVKCKLSGGDSFKYKPILTINYTNDDGESVSRVLATGADGVYKGAVYSQGQTQQTGIAERFRIEGEDIPSPIPTPKPKPKPRPTKVPTPEVTPQTAPAKIPTKRPTKTPTRIPYANPVTIRTTNTQSLPGITKAPVRPPVRTPVIVAPAPQPTTRTKTQTQTGTPTRASKPPVKTTNKADHFIKQARGTYGRISGRTAAFNTAQIAQETGRIEQKAVKAIKDSNLAGDLLGKLVAALLTTQPPVTYTLNPACSSENEDDQEDPTSIDIPLWIGFGALRRRLDAIALLLQAHKDLKQPICDSPKNTGGAYWRSISFESTAYSPNSNARLVKRFRYRADSPGDVRQLAAHWSLFEWDTGPVIVRHSGSALGSPQVWASSVDEGKRVIQHAGAEAGIDPDQVGQWSVSGSDNPRYGVSLTVSLKRVDGCWSATARQGPNGWPEAA